MSTHMMNVATSINLLTTSNNLRRRSYLLRQRSKGGRRVRNDTSYSTSVDGVRVKEPPLIMKEKFEEAWKRQEEEISKHNITLKDKWSYTEYGGYCCGGHEKVYDDGKIAERYSYSESSNDEMLTRYDRLGNCVQSGHKKYTYYEGTKLKEFEWTRDGIRHFDKEGNDNTDKYFRIHQITSKRIKAEKEEKTVYPKMSKLEKAIAVMNVNKDKLTTVERMLIGKRKKQR